MNKQSETQEEETLREKLRETSDKTFADAFGGPAEESAADPVEKSSEESVLVADIGNSNIVIGYFTEDELLFTMRIPTHSGFTTDKLYAMITAEM